MPRRDRRAPGRPARPRPLGPRYQPTHRASTPEPRLRNRLWRSAALTGAAVATTGLAIAAGALVTSDDTASSASSALPAPAPGSVSGAATGSGDGATTVRSPRRVAPADLDDRATRVSRSDRRTSVDEVKKSALDQDPGGQATRTEDLTARDPRTVARALLPVYGFDSDQFSCLDALYVSESGWNVHADNPSSSAYGIPQSLPGSKMASAGADWEHNPVTQIRWGLGYIKDRYGTPCSAWSFKQGHNWY